MEKCFMHIAIVILTFNAGSSFAGLLADIEKQKNCSLKKIVIDSGSEDETVNLARRSDFEIIEIDQRSFNHGDTRQLCVNYVQAAVDVVVFLTQDVRLYDECSLQNIALPFKDLSVGAVYGRQLPHENASPIAAQARLFNYPEQSRLKTYADKEKLGLKTPFMSDSFAAYRVSALNAIKGFPHVIVSEDMYVGARLLKAGWNIAYAAEAKVYHSHDYTLLQEFRRYFDIGVFQAREAWIRAEFGGAEGEGLKLVFNQLKYLWQNNAFLSIPKALLANAIRLGGYRMGIYERRLPLPIKRFCSAQAYFFTE